MVQGSKEYEYLDLNNKDVYVSEYVKKSTDSQIQKILKYQENYKLDRLQRRSSFNKEDEEEKQQDCEQVGKDDQESYDEECVDQKSDQQIKFTKIIEDGKNEQDQQFVNDNNKEVIEQNKKYDHLRILRSRDQYESRNHLKNRIRKLNSQIDREKNQIINLIEFKKQKEQSLFEFQSQQQLAKRSMKSAKIESHNIKTMKQDCLKYPVIKQQVRTDQSRKSSVRNKSLKLKKYDSHTIQNYRSGNIYSQEYSSKDNMMITRDNMMSTKDNLMITKDNLMITTRKQYYKDGLEKVQSYSNSVKSYNVYKNTVIPFFNKK